MIAAPYPSMLARASVLSSLSRNAFRVEQECWFRTLSFALLLVFVFPAATANAFPPDVYIRAQEASLALIVDGEEVGSGWVAYKEGLVVTVAHAFDAGAKHRIELMSYDGNLIPATLVAVDRGHDIAVLRPETQPKAALFLPLARKRPTVGETIFQFGAPLHRSGVLQPGNVAAPGTAFEYFPEQKDYVEVAYIAALMQRGTSGGPWLNSAGEVVGIQSATVTTNDVLLGIAFMSPADFIGSLLDTLHDAATPTLGLRGDELWQQDHAFLAKWPSALKGVIVGALNQDGPAANAGVKLMDIITAIDGRRVNKVRELLLQIRSRKPGDKVTLEVRTLGEAKSVRREVILGCVEAGSVQQPDSPGGGSDR